MKIQSVTSRKFGVMSVPREFYGPFEVMEGSAPRKFYGQELDDKYDDWGHEFADYVTDYIVCILGLVIGVWGIKTFARKKCHVEYYFCLFTLFNALMMGIGGVSHHFMDSYYRKNESMHWNFSEVNYEWAVFWALTGVGWVGFGALFSITFKKSRKVFIGAGIFMCGLEILLLCMAYLEYLCAHRIGHRLTSLPAWLKQEEKFFLKLDSAKALVGGVFAPPIGILGAWKAKNETLALSMGIYFFAWVFVLFLVPSGCRKAGEHYDCVMAGFTIPKEFGRNAIFHSVMVISQLVAVPGLRKRDHQEQETFKYSGGDSYPCATDQSSCFEHEEQVFFRHSLSKDEGHRVSFFTEGPSFFTENDEQRVSFFDEEGDRLEHGAAFFARASTASYGTSA